MATYYNVFYSSMFTVWSQIKKIDNNYYYVDAVNRVRINYKSMKDTEGASEIEKCVQSNNDSKMTDRQDNRWKKRY